MPVGKKHHHDQLPKTPCWRTKSVTRFGVSVEKVVATMDAPNNHHGMERLLRKKDSWLFPEDLETIMPSNIVTQNTAAIIP